MRYNAKENAHETCNRNTGRSDLVLASLSRFPPCAYGAAACPALPARVFADARVFGGELMPVLAVRSRRVVVGDEPPVPLHVVPVVLRCAVREVGNVVVRRVAVEVPD